MRLKNLGVIHCQKPGWWLPINKLSIGYTTESKIPVGKLDDHPTRTKINIDQAWQWAMSNPPVEQQRCPHWASVRSRGHTLRQDKQPTGKELALQCCNGCHSVSQCVTVCCFQNVEQSQLKYNSTWMDSLERICNNIQCCNGDGLFATSDDLSSVEILFLPGQFCRTSDCLRWTYHLHQSTSGWTFPSCSCGLVGRGVWAIKSDILVLGHESVICSSNL